MEKKDEYLPDGTRMFNPTKPHGVVYGGGKDDGQWVQDGVTYRADRTPLGYEAKVVNDRLLKLSKG